MAESPNAAKAAAAAESSPFLVQIGQIYEGPFDLLLDLIRRQNVSIYDIPIAAITTEYLRYLESLRELEVEVAAEFLVVAATLIQIKSRMMLPADPTLPGEAPAADPRDELVQRLLEYEAYKQAAAQLHQRQQIEAASWSRPYLVPEVAEIEDEPGQVTVGVRDLIATFRQVLLRLEEKPRLEILREEVSVRDMMDHLHQLLAASEQPIAVRDVFERTRSRSALLATFLAVLELVKMNVAQLRQTQAFGDILLRRHPRFHDAWRALNPTPAPGGGTE